PGRAQSLLRRPRPRRRLRDPRRPAGDLHRQGLAPGLRVPGADAGRSRRGLGDRRLRLLSGLHMSLGLRGKMLAFTFGIVVLLVALSLGVIPHFVARQVQAGIVEQLTKTRSVFESFMQARGGWLRTEGSVVADDPRFTAILDIPQADLGPQSR